MSGEIAFGEETGRALYAVVKSATGLFAKGTTLEAFVAADWPAYAVSIAELAAGSGQYAGDFPGLPAGVYRVEVYLRAGATPAPSDGPPIACGSIQWDGARETVLAPTQAAAGGGYQLTAAALALAPSAGGSGTGARVVTQDYGGAGNLAVVDAHGAGIAGVTVQAFLTSDWTTSPINAPVRAQQVTLATGAWAGPMNLDPGAYTFVFNMPGYVDSTKAVTVT